MTVGEGDALGRVNLIGEHTDYNGGLVLPTLIALATAARVVTREDDAIRARSASLVVEELRLGHLRRTSKWTDYVAGVVSVLRARGHALRGFDITVLSTIPQGAGLASSAALMVATARALREAFDLSLDDREIADVTYEAETEFVGARVGRMDQLVCSIGREGEALFIDTRSSETRAIPLAALRAEIAVIDSGIRHAHATGDYNTRRAECEEAARALGVRSLRDVEASTDLSGLAPSLARRVRHVVSENARVLAALEAIGAGDARQLGATFNASHDSLRDDYEVSIPEIDAIVDAARGDRDCYGARITGGGFGGSVILLARSGTAGEVARRVAERARERAEVLLPLG